MKKSVLILLAIIPFSANGYSSFADQIARFGFSLPQTSRLCPIHNIATVATVAALGAALIGAIKLAYDSAKKASDDAGDVLTLKKRSFPARVESFKKFIPKAVLCTAGLIGTYIAASLISAISAGKLDRSDVVPASIGSLAVLGLIFYALRDSGAVAE
jgi:hypothetical protein